ncbi:hypothetical protein GCM10009780_36590 [Actinomadura alba]
MAEGPVAEGPVGEGRARWRGGARGRDSPDREQPDAAHADQGQRIDVGRAPQGTPVQAGHLAAVAGAALDRADPVARPDPPARPYRRAHGQIGRPERAMRDHDHAPSGEPCRVCHAPGARCMDRPAGVRREIDTAVTGSPGLLRGIEGP